MLGELEATGRTIVFDMEAGVGTLLRMEPGQADVVLVVVEPTAKAIEAGRRHAEVASQRARVVVVANKLRDDGDLEAVRRALDPYELVAVPEDAAIALADRDGRAPIDAAPAAPGVARIVELAGRLSG